MVTNTDAKWFKYLQEIKAYHWTHRRPWLYGLSKRAISILDFYEFDSIYDLQEFYAIAPFTSLSGCGKSLEKEIVDWMNERMPGKGLRDYK